jgi:exodeoxyribonuclease V beta subunit
VDELAFELPLVGGDAPAAGLELRAIGALLRRHLPADDVLAGYAERLDDPVLQQELRGYLAGSLDLVVRTRGAGEASRFAVVDYKTNWLAPDGEALSAWHHRPAALAEAMQRAHYPLQALLYSAALHRYLRWRLSGYDPDRNLAGVAYLFLRGMDGAGTPRLAGQPCGVFAWRPPGSLVTALSDLLDRGGEPA